MHTVQQHALALANMHQACCIWAWTCRAPVIGRKAKHLSMHCTCVGLQADHGAADVLGKWGASALHRLQFRCTTGCFRGPDATYLESVLCYMVSFPDEAYMSHTPAVACMRSALPWHEQPCLYMQVTTLSQHFNTFRYSCKAGITRVS